MLKTEVDFKDRVDGAKNVVALGVVLLLICLVSFVWIGFQYWEVWGIFALGAIAMVGGFNLYFKSKRGLQKCKVN